MPLIAGSARLKTGLAGAIRAEMQSNTKKFNIKHSEDFINSLAAAIVEHVVANMTVTVPAGIPVLVAVPAGTGATTAPSIGVVT